MEKIIKVNKAITGTDVAEVVFQASQFKSHVHLKTKNSIFNIKSLMGMFALQLEPGMEVMLEANGEDEQEAIQHMSHIFG